jgi:hypothetical protein
MPRLARIWDTSLLSGPILDVSGPVLDTSDPHSGLQVRLYLPHETLPNIDIDRVLFLADRDLQPLVALFPATSGVHRHYHRHFRINSILSKLPN